jgi:hypothetical protein
MAKATQAAVWLAPGLDPMAFLSYVPVAWIFVNAALWLATARAIGLPRELQLLTMLCFSLSPLLQLMHAIGMIDHHYVEHTFVMLSIWLGLLWLKQPADTRRAAALGVALGVAPAFHNGLFILQLVPLATLFLLWLRGTQPPSKALRSFGLALLIATQLILLPSEPYRNGMFEFGLLSWFHFYIAVCTAVTVAFLAWRPFSRLNLGLLAAVCAALAIPIATQLTGGVGFLSGTFSILDQITEVQSPYKLLTQVWGPTETASYYSWLLVLAPALLAYFAYRTVRESNAARLYFAVAATLGLALLLAQYRLHYFGIFCLFAGALSIVEDLRARRNWHRGGVFVGAFAALVLALQPSLRERLFIVYAPAGDTEYSSAFPIFLNLEELCAKDPGVVLASADDGSAIVFHSQCSVIANNFILREEDKAHIDEINRLMRMTPEQVRTERPDVKYVFVRVRDFSLLIGNEARIVEESPMGKQLFLDDEPPPGYTLIGTIKRRIGEDGYAGIYARLYRVTPSVTASAP